MSVENFLKGVEIGGEGMKRAEKRKAAEQTSKAMADLGGQIKGSMAGSTDMGQLVGSAVGAGLVENPIEGLKMLNMTPEKFTFDVGVRGIKDPDARAQYTKIAKLFENNNFLKANGAYRAMRANKLGGGGKDKDGKDVKLEKIKMDLGKVVPTVVSKLNQKYKITDAEGQEISADKFSFSKNVYANPEYMDVTKGYVEDLESEIRNTITQTYPEYAHKDAAGSREAAVNSIMSMVIYSQDLSGLGKYSSDKKERFDWDFYESQIPLSVLIDTFTEENSAEDLGFSVEEEITPAQVVDWGFDIPEKRTVKILKGRGKSKTTVLGGKKEPGPSGEGGDNGGTGEIDKVQ